MENVRSVKIKLEVDTNKRTIERDFNNVSTFINYLIEQGVLSYGAGWHEVNTDEFLK